MRPGVATAAITTVLFAATGALRAQSASPIEPSGTITGVATYRERMMLPPDAVFEATLSDIFLADAPAVFLDSTRVANPRTSPIHFTLHYDPAKIVDGHLYAVRAEIQAAGRLVFTTDQVYAVITQGHPTDVQVMLRHVAAEPAPSPPPPPPPPSPLPPPSKATPKP